MRTKTVYFKIGFRTFGVKFRRDAGRWVYYGKMKKSVR